MCVNVGIDILQCIWFWVSKGMGMKKILSLKTLIITLCNFSGRNEITVTVLLEYMTALLEYFDLWFSNIGQINFSYEPITKRVLQTLGYFLGTPLSFHRFQRKCETEVGMTPFVYMKSCLEDSWENFPRIKR